MNEEAVVDSEDFYENVEIRYMGDWMIEHIYALKNRRDSYSAEAKRFRKNLERKYIDDKTRAWLAERAQYLEREIATITKLVAFLETYPDEETQAAIARFAEADEA